MNHIRTVPLIAVSVSCAGLLSLLWIADAQKPDCGPNCTVARKSPPMTLQSCLAELQDSDNLAAKWKAVARHLYEKENPQP